jgi:hypothetical protein
MQLFFAAMYSSISCLKCSKQGSENENACRLHFLCAKRRKVLHSGHYETDRSSSQRQASGLSLCGRQGEGIALLVTSRLNELDSSVA